MLVDPNSKAAPAPPADAADRLAEGLARWTEVTMPKAARRLGVDPGGVNRPRTPLDLKGHDFQRDVALPGEYPFTSWLYPTRAIRKGLGDTRIHRAGRYSGYGTSEDCREYYREQRQFGRLGGANIASDLPSQLGWDSDDPRAESEVGRVGVAIDSLRDFEIVYEAFTGDSDIDKVSSNWTINAPAAVYVAYYCALAQKRGIPIAKLRCTPQNDILKEYCARGQYIFPVRPSLKLVKDIIEFMTREMPNSNSISICAGHIRYGGATTVQSLAFAFANAMAYVRLGLEAGLAVDDFVPRFTFRGFGDSSLDFYQGIASARASRRIWARIMREKFGARDDRTCMLRGGEHAWGNAYMKMSVQRPVNNIVRETIEAVICSLASGEIPGGQPFDEPLGLGHSLEAQQIARDITRILQYEANIGAYLDPFAGSYVIESLTDEIETDIRAEIDRIEAIGGPVAAVETGYYKNAIAESAWQAQKRFETREDIWVGVNAFNGPENIDVEIKRTPEYHQDLLETAEARQVAALKQLRRERSSADVTKALAGLRATARDNSANLMPSLIKCAHAYATIGETCDVLRDVYGVEDLE
ncbi:MAG TPA: methylmalonyl-CoA mutase family protein [Rhodoblastus sp.]|nr:methylmalonyl-CoA mutase family protein [Rhodoblastus sp.]